MSVNCGGVQSNQEVTGEWKKYTLLFEATSARNEFSIYTDGEVTICDLQLERGTVATAWGYSWLDNNSDRVYWQSMKYLQQAIAGSSTVAGGLILTNLIQLGSQSNNSEFVEKAGVSGLYVNDDSLAFWAGGTMQQAIDLVKAYSDNAGADITDEQAAALAKFAVTHGGNAILNNAILRGTVYAQNGVFGGRLQLKFQRVQNDHVLSLTDSSSIWIEGAMEDAVLNLPEDDSFDGWMLNVFAYPVISKLDGQPYVRGRILCPHLSTAGDIYHASQIYLPNGGHLEFTYNTIKHEWVLLNDQSNGAEYTRYEE